MPCHLSSLVTYFLFIIVVCKADYECLCSYNVEKTVNSSPLNNSRVLGYLYEFDCKPALSDDKVDPNIWSPIAFEKQMGYVLIDQQTVKQVCPGDPSVTDALTTKPSTSATTKSTSTSSTPQTVPSTVIPTSSTVIPTPSTTQTIPSTATPKSSTVSPTSSTVIPTLSTVIPTSSTVIPTSSTTQTVPSTVTPTSSTNSPTSSTDIPTSTTVIPTSSTPQSVPSTGKSTTRTLKVNTTKPSPISTTDQVLIVSTTGLSLSASASSSPSNGRTSITSVAPTSTKANIAANVTATAVTKTNTTTMLSTLTAVLKTSPSTLGFLLSTQDPSTVPHKTWNYTSTTLIPSSASTTSTVLASTSHTPVTNVSTTVRNASLQFSTHTPSTPQPITSKKTTIMQTNMTATTLKNGTLTTTLASAAPSSSSLVTSTPNLQTSSTIFVIPSSTQSVVKSTTVSSTPPASTIPSLTGDVSLCPATQVNYAQKYNDILAQFGNSCYTVVSFTAAWQHAENICQSHGGHLLHIANKAENDFIYNLLHVRFRHPVWIGLHDTDSEGTFKWTSGIDCGHSYEPPQRGGSNGCPQYVFGAKVINISCFGGDPVYYTNWLPNRQDNHENHRIEDCVEFIPYTNNGAWDDIPCGYYDNDDHDEDEGYSRSFICQHDIIQKPSNNLAQTLPTSSAVQSATSSTPNGITGDLSKCPQPLVTYAKSSGNILAQYTGSCYLVVDSQTTWKNAENWCQGHGGHLLHISNADENNFIYTLLSDRYSHAVWIGLHDTNHEEHFKWTSGDPVTYKNWLPDRKNNHDSHYEEDCVEFIPYRNHGAWDDIPCGEDGRFTKAFICQNDIIQKPANIALQTPTSTSILPSSSQVSLGLTGDLSKCPSSLLTYAQTFGDILVEYRDNCYMIVDFQTSWKHAEDLCRGHGGHLLHISNEDENNFIYKLLSARYSHAVWMGLHDTDQEEQFKWTSGDPVSYTHWLPGRKNNHDWHSEEDCVEFIPYRNHGAWDDIPCGEDDRFNKAFICQNSISVSVLPSPTIQAIANPCSPSVRHTVKQEGGILTSSRDSCYVLIPYEITWTDAEHSCNIYGGNLLEINDQLEQTFVENFLKRHDPNEAVWLGLHDRIHEGSFVWTTGQQVTYTNWTPGHLHNQVSQDIEDCAIIMPYQQGLWDDVPCGSWDTGLLGKSGNEAHHFICEFGRQTGLGPILVG